MLKKILITLTIVLILSFIAFFYINAVFLPIQLKQIAVKKTRELLHRDITFSEITYNPVKGIIVKDLILFQKKYPKEPFIKIKEASFNVLLASLLKTKTIVIPSLNLSSPEVVITHYGEDKWNFSDLLKPRKTTKTKKPFSLLLGGIEIHEGRVTLKDTSSGLPFEETFTAIDAKAGLSLKKGIDFNLTAQIASNASTLKTKGQYFPSTKTFTASLQTQKFDLAQYLNMFYETKSFTLNEGLIESSDLTISLKNKELEVQGSLAAQTDILFAANKIFKGHLNASNFHLTKKDNGFALNASLIAKDASFHTVKRIFKGNFIANNAQLTIKGKNFDLEGDFTINDAFVPITKTKPLTGDITAKNLTIQSQKETFNANGHLTINNTVLVLSDDNKLTGDLSLKNAVYSKEGPANSLKGELEMQKTKLAIGKNFTLQGDLKVPLAEFALRKRFFSFETDSLSLEKADIQLAEGKNLAGSFHLKETSVKGVTKNVTVRTQGLIDKAKLSVNEITFTDSPKFQIDFSFHPEKDAPYIYSGSFELADARVDGIKKVEKATDIKGLVSFVPNKLETKNLTFTTLKTPLQVSGILNNFQHPFLDIKATAEEVKLTTLTSLFSGLAKKIKITPKGLAKIHLHYTGDATSPENSTITCTADLKNTSLKGEKLPDDITNISGQLHYIQNFQNSLAWKNLTGTLKGHTYTLDGSLKDFLRPILETKIKNEYIDLSTRIKILKNTLNIFSLTGNFFNSSFNIKGDVFLRENSLPSINTTGTFSLNLADLEKKPIPFIEKTKKLKATGILTINALFNGNLSVWKNATIDINAKGPEIAFHEYKLNQVNLKLTQNNTTPLQFTLDSLFYGGKLAVSASTNSEKEGRPFKLTTHLENIQLSKLKKDTALKDKDISGLLTFGSNIQGFLDEPEAIGGSGSMMIIDGKIWKLNFLKGIWGALLISEFNNIVFTEAQSKFDLIDKKIILSDLLLHSKPVDLHGKGWIGLDKKINLQIRPNFKEAEIIQSRSIMKGTTAIITQIADNTVINISGSLDKPQFEKTLIPQQIIEKATDVLLEGVRSILEEIF